MFMPGRKSVTARRVGPNLVAAFRNSRPPLVWTFDLERNHSFALVLEGEDGDLELGVASPKGEFHSVARFAAREDAEEALAAVQKVLMKKKRGWLGTAGLVLVLTAVAVLAVVVAAAYVSAHGHPSMASYIVPQAPVMGPGVPLPANQVLRPPP